jgi:hypothetical protein
MTCDMYHVSYGALCVFRKKDYTHSRAPIDGGDMHVLQQTPVVQKHSATARPTECVISRLDWPPR